MSEHTGSLANNFKPSSVSIIVTVYNSGDFLEFCLRSLTRQSLKNIEIIVVDDGSEDPRDKQIVRMLMLEDDRIIYIQNGENRGTGFSREVGVSQATGDYIGFLDADDYADPKTYETLLRAATKNNCDIAICDFYTTAEHGWWNPQELETSSGTERVLDGPTVFDAQMNRRHLPYYLRMDWWNKIYRRDLFVKNNIKFPHVVRNEGTMSMIMTILANKCVIIDTPLFYSFTRPGSVCRQFRKRNIQDTIDSTQHFGNYLKQLGYYKKYKDRFIDLFYFIIFNHNLTLILREEKDAREEYLEALLGSLHSTPNIRLEFLHYLTRQHRRLERLVFASLSGRKSWNMLKLIKETKFEERQEGGNRLLTRQSWKIPHRVSLVTVTKDLIKNGRVKFFERMLKSVEDQTYGRTNIEHIIIDGNSTDGTISYLQDLADAKKIDYWVSEQDSGIYNAMNKGIVYSSGDYILYLNSDDYLSNDALEKLVSNLRTHQADYAFGNALKVDENETPVGTHLGDINKVFFGAPYCHQTLLCKRTMLEHIKFDERYKLTMWPFALDLHMAGHKSVHVNEFVANFRVGGISTNPASEQKFIDEQTWVKIECNCSAPKPYL